MICFPPRYIPTKFKRRCETVDLNTRCDGARPVLREKSISFLLAFINVVGVCKANSRLLLRKIISTALPRTLRQYSKLNYHRVYSKAGEGVFCAVLFRGVMLLGKCSKLRGSRTGCTREAVLNMDVNTAVPVKCKYVCALS